MSTEKIQHAPDPKTVRKGDFKHACFCNWKECKDLQAAIQKHADESHEWNGPLQCITMSDSPKPTALRASIQKHLKVDKIAAERKMYYVALHHWSRSLLAEKKKNGHRTTFLSQTEATKFDEADNHGRHAEACNQVLVLLRKANYGLSSKQELAFKNKFVQGPITSYGDVSTFVKTLSSPCHLERMSKRQKMSLHKSNLSHTSLPSSSSQLQIRPADADFALNDMIHPHEDEDGTTVAASVEVAPLGMMYQPLESFTEYFQKTYQDDDDDGTTATAAVDVASPGMFPPLGSFNEYFQKKYQELGCDIEAFRLYPNVLRDLKMVQIAYGRDHVVALAPNVYLVHCAGKGSVEDDCGLFATRSKKPGNERRPACDSCTRVLRVQARRLSRKQASIQHRARFAKNCESADKTDEVQGWVTIAGTL
jgi:hypothetical protein